MSFIDIHYAAIRKDMLRKLSLAKAFTNNTYNNSLIRKYVSRIEIVNNLRRT